MKVEYIQNSIAFFAGIAMLFLAVLFLLEKVPVFSLYPSKTEKEKQKNIRFHVIGYGGMGLISLSQSLYYFFHWSWAWRMQSAATIVTTLYLLVALIGKRYIKGYIPGDSIDDTAE